LLWAALHRCLDKVAFLCANGHVPMGQLSSARGFSSAALAAECLRLSSALSSEPPAAPTLVQRVRDAIAHSATPAAMALAGFEGRGYAHGDDDAGLVLEAFRPPTTVVRSMSNSTQGSVTLPHSHGAGEPAGHAMTHVVFAGAGSANGLMATHLSGADFAPTVPRPPPEPAAPRFSSAQRPGQRALVRPTTAQSRSR
jgi:hypothetical protein